MAVEPVTEPTARRRGPVAAVLAAIGLVGLAVSAALVWVFPAGAAEDAAAAQEVATAASDFAATYTTYDSKDVGSYQERVAPMLTEAYREQFITVTDSLFDSLATKNQRGEGAVVQSVAVDALTGDSARALVALDATLANDDAPEGVVQNFRWIIDFERVDGAWLIDQYQPVASVDATATTESAPTGDEQ